MVRRIVWQSSGCTQRGDGGRRVQQIPAVQVEHRREPLWCTLCQVSGNIQAAFHRR